MPSSPAHPSRPSFTCEPDTLIGGQFRVIEQLGKGGMGIVLRARDAQLERDVAIKLIRPDLVDDKLRRRFLTEARAMARVNHPNVMPIYAFGEHQGAPFFVTQVVRGPSVETWLARRSDSTSPDLDVVFKILEETCRGVSAIHAAETVHRDLKPSNLLLDEGFGVRIADMGVATRTRNVRMTGRREIVGTPDYMAPESVLQTNLPPELASRVDVYALGCLAFELFTGHAPFVRKGTLARMLAHVQVEAPHPSHSRPDLPQAIDDLVLAALEKDPVRRTPSADAFGRALAAARAKTKDPVRILLAEDDEDFREILAATLGEEFPDAIVERVSDGEAALDAFDRELPSVVLLDLCMPKIDGIELTRTLRSRPRAQAVPIVVLTGSGGPKEWQRLAEIGADGFLVKPVNVKDVATLLRRALAERARFTPMPPRPERAEDIGAAVTAVQGRRAEQRAG